MSNQSKNKSILYIIILILLVFNLGLFYLWQAGKGEKNAAVKVNEEMSATLEERNKAISAAEALIEQYRNDSATLAQSGEKMSAELAARSSEIARLTYLLKKNDKNSRLLVDELTNKIKELDAKLAALEEENVQLKDRNDSLQNQNMSLYAKNTNLEVESKKLKNLAARLTTQDIRVETLKKQSLTGKEVNTIRARSVDALRISFNISENNVAEAGDREIFVKITGPEGITLSQSGQGGVVELENGKSTKYSYKTSVVFEKDLKQVPSSIWKPSQKLNPGKYSIEVYTEGYLMGSQVVDLK
jgi:predicted RNase H-like nuclease (RuvC/YqgF family)